MGDLAVDTAVEGDGAGRYRGDLSPDWEIWGPNGGYVASIALRAAAAESRLVRPASLSCHYLSSARFGPVELEVVPLRQAKRAESLRVTMTQGETPVLEALVWMIDDIEGMEHDHAPMPDVPAHADLLSVDELAAGQGDRVQYSFFDNLEQRPTVWIDDWEHREPGEPRATSWFRFRPAATFEDVLVDACRSLILVDTMEWPAAARAHTGQLPWMAPSLDLAVRFHRFEPESEWLLTVATAPVAAEGLIGGTGAVWSATGRLLASGGQQMLCRPVPA